MKKIILISAALLICLGTFAQKGKYLGTITVPVGASDTVSKEFGHGNSFGAHYEYSALDDTDGTLAIYGSNFHPDSVSFILLFIDEDGDENNDNPKTLSDTEWGFWGEAFPYIYYIEIFTKVSNTSGYINRDIRKW